MPLAVGGGFYANPPVAPAAGGLLYFDIRRWVSSALLTFDGTTLTVGSGATASVAIGSGAVTAGGLVTCAGLTSGLAANPTALTGPVFAHDAASPNKGVWVGFDTTSGVGGYIQAGNFGTGYLPLELNPIGTTTSPVLIGQTTTDGVNKLQVTGSAAFSAGITATGSSSSVLGGTFQVASNATGSSNYPVLLLSNTDTTTGNGAGLRFLGVDTSAGAHSGAQILCAYTNKTASVFDGTLIFKTSLASVDGTRFTINPNGDSSFSSTTSASSAIAGALTVGNGTAATSVAFGAGKINCGDSFTAGASSTITKSASGVGVSLTIANTAAAAAGNAVQLFMDDGTGHLFQISCDANGSTTSLKAITRNTAMDFWTGLASGAQRLAIDNVGVITTTNTTDASAVGTAGVVFAGGLSVAKNIFTGGRILANTATVGVASFASASDTSPATTASWDDTKHILLGGVANSSTAFGLGFSLDLTGNTASLICLTPGTAWRTFTARVNVFNVALGGSTTNSFVVSTNATTVGIIGTSQTGAVIAGVQTALAAVAGQVGEVLSATQSTYTNYTTTATYQQVTTLSLTAGDWDIVCFGTLAANGSTLTVTANSIFTLSTTTASAAGTTEGAGDIAYVSQVINAASGRDSIVLHKRVNINATTSYFLNSQSTFTLGNPQFVGSIVATRIR